MAWTDFPCKVYPRGKDSHGYGRVAIGGKDHFVHRVIWMIERGGIPRLLNVLHHCDNPPCYEIEHLFIGTHQDNAADRDAKGRCGAGKRNSEKTHCIRGHPFDDENTYWHRGKRNCKACIKVRRTMKTLKRYNNNQRAKAS